MRKIISAAAMLSSLFQMSVMAQNLGISPPPPRGRVLNPNQHMQCATPSPSTPSAVPVPLSLPPLMPLPCIRHLNINVHFMLRDDGSGNFNQQDDGLGNREVNGYRFADTLIDIVNTKTAFFDNIPLLFYDAAMGQPANLPLNMKLVLKGVYYHRNSNYYNFVHGGDPSVINATYAIKNDKEINLFISNPTDAAGNYANFVGQANAFGGAANSARISVGSPWQVDYKTFINWGWSRPDAMYWSASNAVGVLVHEIGHLLDLYHAFGGDYCDDTRAANRCWNLNEPKGGFSVSDCNNWNQISNNVMDYTAHQHAFSPCQIDRMNAKLAGTMAPFVHSCVWKPQYVGYLNSCPPASSFFDFPAQANVCKAAVSKQPIVWGQASYGESSYAISLNRTDAVGSHTVLGGMQRWAFTGEVAKINLTSLRSTWISGFYRIGLKVTNSCGLSDSSYRWSYIQGNSPFACPDTLIGGPPLSNRLHIFPNPGLSGGSVQISSPEGMYQPYEKISIRIGRPERSSEQVYERIADKEGILNATIPLKSHLPGIYFISATGSSGHTTHQKLSIY